jgi:hypothetical protein
MVVEHPRQIVERLVAAFVKYPVSDGLPDRLERPNAEPEAVPSASDAERPMPDEDGTPLRIHYDSHNGYPFSAVGRVLIERNLIPREISMQRIREWMAAQSRGSTEAASHQPLVCVLPHNWVNERG